MAAGFMESGEGGATYQAKTTQEQSQFTSLGLELGVWGGDLHFMFHRPQKKPYNICHSLLTIPPRVC